MLHLAWHHELKAGPVGSWYWWIEPTLEPERARPFARLCRLLRRKYVDERRRISYALRYTDGTFDPESGDFLTSDGIGLTCATFVLAVFASRKVFLIRGEEWLACRDETRAVEDGAWHQYVVSNLRELIHDKRQRRAAPYEVAELEAHIAAVEGEMGCARFRPEEVAAAGIAAELPVGFAHAEPVGRRIVEKLRQRFPRPMTG